MIKQLRKLIKFLFDKSVSTIQKPKQKPKFPNDTEKDKWYLDQGWKKTDWGYEYKIDGIIGYEAVFDMKKRMEQGDGVWYDCTVRPMIKELNPGEGINVGIGT